LFLGETDYQTVEAVRRAEVPSISERNPDVPAELERIIRKALSRELRGRYQRASDFADDLLGFLFSRSLKVSTRELADLLDDLRRSGQSRDEPMAGGSSLILKMINEEFTKFRSLDDDDDSPETGSQPLDTLMGGSPDYDPASPLPFEDFEEPGSPARSSQSTPAAADSQSTSGAHAAQSRPRSPSRMPSPAPRKEGSMAPWLVLLGLLLAGGGAYYWLIVLGNLDRFS